MTEDQIKHMAERFLTWRLPDEFHPDGGISFAKHYNQNTPYPAVHEPVGTNLFTYEQARGMIKHMLEGLPGLPNSPEVENAYGLLWRDTAPGDKKNEARKLLLAILDKQGQRRGIEFATEKYGPVSDAEALRDFP